METDFILLGSKITPDGDCSHEIKRCVFLGRKAMTSLDSILKSRDVTLPTKVCIVKAMVFPVVMYGCENCTIKKAAPWRIDAFELWCWKRPLRVPVQQGGESNQSTLKKTLNIHWKDWCWTLNILWKDWCWNWSSITLATWCEGRLIGRDPDAGKDWGQEEKGVTEDEMIGWRGWLNGYELEQAPGDSKGLGSLECCSSWHRKESDTT